MGAPVCKPWGDIDVQENTCTPARSPQPAVGLRLADKSLPKGVRSPAGEMMELWCRGYAQEGKKVLLTPQEGLPKGGHICTPWVRVQRQRVVWEQLRGLGWVGNG